MPAERVPLEVHLDAMTIDERALWDRYLELIERAGESELIVTKSGMAFRAPHSRFSGCFFKTRRLELWFDLPTPVAADERDGRFRDVWQHSPTKWVHRLTIGGPEQLDDTLAGWLAASRDAYSRPAAERS